HSPMLTLAVPPDFDLPRAVCSYGFFMLAPNRWDTSNQVLHTVLHGEGDRHLPVSVSSRLRRSTEQRHTLQITTPAISRAEALLLKSQLARILRIDEDLTPFHRLHRKAKRAGFGRLYRSATLFEDIVKTMTCCNVTWSQTKRMNELLVEKVGKTGFPTPAQLAACKPSRLQAQCKLGYRAERIVRLGRDVCEGRIDLSRFEASALTTAELFDGLREIHGIGPYAANNLCQCLGRYDRLAIDSETYRHFREKHDVPTPRDASGIRKLHDTIEAHYAKFAPYQFLAYWFELWGAYEDRFGVADVWPISM
ncbi:MAG: hypothetical protein WD768_00095, partial [Phycisphaeraceae bacterium]